jgi:hypothetical protein
LIAITYHVSRIGLLIAKIGHIKTRKMLHFFKFLTHPGFHHTSWASKSKNDCAFEAGGYFFLVDTMCLVYMIGQKKRLDTLLGKFMYTFCMLLQRSTLFHTEMLRQCQSPHTMRTSALSFYLGGLVFCLQVCKNRPFWPLLY